MTPPSMPSTAMNTGAATTAPHPAAPPRSPWADDPLALKTVARLQRVCPQADPLRYLPDVHPARIPRHIAVIMDGNGRWATERGFPRMFGHRNGAAAVRELMREAGHLGVEVLTLYSFSQENWKRPSEEVEGLMHLYALYLEGEAQRLVDENIRFVQIGRRRGLPQPVLDAVDRLTRLTSACTGPTLCVAVNYGSRAEIVDAARTIAQRVRSGELDPDAIDEETFEACLYTAGIPEPDLLIRTAGERRISNFLLWQISYAEIHVSDVLWPDFGAPHLHAAVRDYASRSRRFGGLTDQTETAHGRAGGSA